MKTNITKEQALSKAEAYCAKSEHCEAEIRKKLLEWKVDQSDVENVVSHLINERYIDDHRFAKAFVRDKFRFEHWGKAKIAQYLRVKQIDPSMIDEALNEIDEVAYIDTLHRLLVAKSRNMTAYSEYERNGRLIRFALGRGFEMTDILTCLPQSDTTE